MDVNIDWDLLHRLDRSMVTDFLTSSASALVEQEFMDQKNSDDLRVCLHEADISGIGESLLSELEKSQAPFLRTLKYRYGNIRIALNLSRMAIRPIFLSLNKLNLL